MKVEAEANTDSNKRPGFTPRKGQGLAIFGKSSSQPPVSRVWPFFLLSSKALQLFLKIYTILPNIGILDIPKRVSLLP